MPDLRTLQKLPFMLYNQLDSPGIRPPASTSDGFGSKIFDPGRVGSIFCGSDRVGSAIYGLG